MRGSLFRCTVLASTAALWVMAPSAAAAQAPAERDVRIEFEVGDFDAARSDWPITEVLVSGDLDVGETFVVELRDGDGGIIWAGEDEYSPPQTIVAVDTFVAVGDVEEAAIGQRLPVEPPPEIEPAVDPVATQEPEVAAVVTTIAPDDPVPVVVPPDPAPTPDVAADVVSRPDPPLPQQGSGLGGAGQLALSMAIAVVFVAILFRTPLPAATTMRWRK